MTTVPSVPGTVPVTVATSVCAAPMRGGTLTSHGQWVTPGPSRAPAGNARSDALTRARTGRGSTGLRCLVRGCEREL